MLWRLIIFIVIFAVFLAFITFNLDNKCDISFGFTKIADVPVFLTIFISFALGLLCTLPFALLGKKKKKEIGTIKLPSLLTRKKEEITEDNDSVNNTDGNLHGID